MLDNLVIPTLNRYDLLERLLKSIDYPVKHLLVIDNGGKFSYTGLPEYVEQMTVFNMPSNLGVATSWNLGIKAFATDPIWFIASDDVAFAPGTLESWAGMSSPSRFIAPDVWPNFQFFSIGEDWVDNVGLFDEAIYPANFEDTEYEWRANALGFYIDFVYLPHDHTAQGTVFHEDYRSKNEVTYPLNEAYFLDKQEQYNLSDGFWSLERRRLNSWD